MTSINSSPTCITSPASQWEDDEMIILSGTVVTCGGDAVTIEPSSAHIFRSGTSNPAAVVAVTPFRNARLLNIVVLD